MDIHDSRVSDIIKKQKENVTLHYEGRGDLLASGVRFKKKKSGL